MDKLLEHIDVDATLAAHHAYRAKLADLSDMQEQIIVLIAERKRLGLPYSSEFWKNAASEESDFTRIDLMLEQTRAGLARCREITEQQKRAAGK